jgi:hypothetical protein
MFKVVIIVLVILLLLAIFLSSDDNEHDNDININTEEKFTESEPTPTLVLEEKINDFIPSTIEKKDIEELNQTFLKRKKQPKGITSNVNLLK